MTELVDVLLTGEQVAEILAMDMSTPSRHRRALDWMRCNIPSIELKRGSRRWRRSRVDEWIRRNEQGLPLKGASRWEV